MVDVELIKSTIKELLDANIDKETIFSTLKDIGAEEGDIQKYYQEMTSDNKKENNKSKEDDNESSQEEITEKKPQKEESKDDKKEDKKNIEEAKKESETADLPEEDKHHKELKDTTTEINSINEKEEKEEQNKIDIKNNTNLDTTKIEEKILRLQEDITEVKANLKALTKIMKDILEENRKILNKL
jgi:hypothetical protein